MTSSIDNGCYLHSRTLLPHQLSCTLDSHSDLIYDAGTSTKHIFEYTKKEQNTRASEQQHAYDKIPSGLFFSFQLWRLLLHDANFPHNPFASVERYITSLTSKIEGNMSCGREQVRGSLEMWCVGVAGVHYLSSLNFASHRPLQVQDLSSLTIGVLTSIALNELWFLLKHHRLYIISFSIAFQQFLTM